MKQPFIRVEHLNFQYLAPNGTQITALRDITLEIQQGELVALIGVNGSGKTTLARHFNALNRPTSGKVWVKSLDTSIDSNIASVRSMVGMIFQNPEDQMIASVVEEEVAFGLENLGIPRPEMARRIRDILHEYGLWKERARSPHLLSSGQIQRLALAGVLVMRPECLVFDETTAMLDPIGRQTVMQSIHDMHSQGRTVVFITHCMEEAVQAERVIVMNGGRIEMDGSTRAVFSNPRKMESLGLEFPRVNHVAQQLTRWIPSVRGVILTIDELDQKLPLFNSEFISSPDQSSSNQVIKTSPLIEVHGLKHVYLQGTPLAHRSLRGVNLSVSTGEVHALLGATGSGKSTLLQHLNGLYRPQSGIVRVDCYNLNDPQVNMKSLRSMVGLVFQNPDMQLFEQYVGDEIAYGPRLSGLQGGELRRSVQGAMEMVGLVFEEFKDRITMSLSGGERKKVTLASALAMSPRILLLDEPLAGLDPRSRKSLMGALNKMVKSGLTLILTSHNLDEITEVASHASLMHTGLIHTSGKSSEIFGTPVIMEKAGLIPPLVPQIADLLRRRGWPLPSDIFREQELVGAVMNLVKGLA